MFSSLASFFQSSMIDHYLIRQMIVHYILHYQQTFDTDIKASGFNNVDQYCREMLRPGVWGDAICLQAFSLIFKINVLVYNVDDKRLMKITDAGTTRPNLVLYYDDDHYDRIIGW